MSYFFLCLIFVLTPVFAEEVVEELQAVQVTAKKNVSDFNFSQPESITTEDLEKEATGLLAPQLNQHPGVIASQNGGPGGQVSFFIRGTQAAQVAFTIDDLKMNDTSNPNRGFDAAFFSAPFLSKVEIYKGPQAVLFGSDAMGGLVEMTTRKGKNPGETRIDLNGGSFGTISSSIGTDWGNKNHKGTLTAYRFHSDGISRLNKKRFKATEKDSADITQLSSSSSHIWNDKLDTDLLFSFLRGENELDGNASDNSNDKSRNDQLIAQQRTNFRLNKTSALSLRNAINQHDRRLDTEFFGSNYKSLYLGNLIQNEALYKFDNQAFSLVGGLASEHEELKGSGVDRSFDLHSLFAQSAYKFSNIKIYGGARAERHVRYGSFYTGSGGVAYFLDNNKFFVQYSQGYKAPSLYQLYAPSFPGFVVGNPNLVPEANHSWEGGWALNNKTYETSVTLFQNRLSNMINYIDTLGYFNQDRFIAEGVEVAGKYKHRHFHLTSSLTHQEFKKAETTVLNRPKNSVLAGVAVFPTDSSEVSLKGRWFSSRMGFKNTTTNVKLNGYEAFDFGMRYMFTSVDIGLQVLNILNREYEDLYGFSTMPRSIFVHTGIRF